MTGVRDDLDEELDSLLREPPRQAAARARRRFDADTGGPPGAIVLFGAGQLGRKTLRGLRTLGIEPLAFGDNDSTAWGRTVDGLPVLSPEAAAARHGDRATFVVTIWPAGSIHRQAATRRQLQALGCGAVTTFAALFWRHPEVFLPHYALDTPEKVLEQAADVRQALGVWADAASRREYVAQVRWRLHLDFDGLPHPVPGEPYFRDELFVALPDEVFVDCGAFDGDSLRVFLRRTAGRFGRVVALEPAPGNAAHLRAWHAGLAEEVRQRIALHPVAAMARPGRLSLSAASGLDATVGHGDLEAAAARLDDLLDGYEPTFVKMDIEGAELEALEGAAGLLRTARPVMAVSVYHRQDHLWRVPLRLRAARERCDVFLLPHSEEVWEQVCYSIPAERRARHA
jgi:FkbM family methyltransferase